MCVHVRDILFMPFFFITLFTFLTFCVELTLVFLFCVDININININTK